MPALLADILVIVGVNAGVAVMYFAIRWRFAPMRWGYIGLLMIFLPMGFDALDVNENPAVGGTSNLDLGIYILFAVIGVFVVIGDLCRNVNWKHPLKDNISREGKS